MKNLIFNSWRSIPPPPPPPPSTEVRKPPSYRGWLYASIALLLVVIVLSSLILLFFAAGVGRTTYSTTTTLTEYVSTTRIIRSFITSTHVTTIPETSTKSTTSYSTSMKVSQVSVTTTATTKTTVYTSKEATYPPGYLASFGNWDLTYLDSTLVLVNDNNYRAQKIVIRDRISVNAIILYIKRSSGTTGKFRVVITTDDDGKPGSTITSTELDATSIGTSFTWKYIYFGGGGFELQPGTYWLLFYSTTSTQYMLRRTTDQVEGYYIKSSDGGATWYEETDYDILFKLFGKINP